MRPRTEAQIRPTLPVAKVVDASVTGLGPVRHLVVLVAGRAEEVARHPVHVCLEIGVGSRRSPRRHRSPERRRRLDRQPIRRNVLGFERDRLHQRAPPRLERLAVRAVDQIEIDVVEPGITRSRESPPNRIRLVDPFQCSQHGGIE